MEVLSMTHSNDSRPIVKDKTKARAGVTGHNVRYVLIFGLIGTIAAFIALAFYFGLLSWGHY